MEARGRGCFGIMDMRKRAWLSVHEWGTDFRVEKTSRDRETRGTPTAIEMDGNRARNNGE